MSFWYFGELDEHITRGCWIEEHDATPPVAGLRLVIEQLDTLALELIDRFIDVLNLEAQVPEALTVLVLPGINGRVRTFGAQ